MMVFDIGAIRLELRKLLGVPVDVLTTNALPDKIRAAVVADAQPVRTCGLASSCATAPGQQPWRESRKKIVCLLLR